MKKTAVLCSLIVCLMAAAGYAQMDDRMMGGSMMDEGMGQSGFGMPGQDMSDIAELMNQMSDMMQKVSSLLSRNLDRVAIMDLSEIVREMSDEMSEISRLAGTSGYSPGDIQDLKWKMRDTEDKLDRLR